MAGFWKKLGKGLLKIAPYAAMTIPGVGVPLGMAIQGGLAAANTKASGGSWKNALLQGGIGAATAGAGAKIPIGPSASGANKFLGGLAGKAGSKGWQSTLGQTAGNIGRNVAGQGFAENEYDYLPENIRPGGGWAGRVKSKMGQEQVQGQYGGEQEPRFGAMPQGGFSYEDDPMNQYNQNTPNLAMTMHQAREDAKRRFVPFQFSDENM